MTHAATQASSKPLRDEIAKRVLHAGLRLSVARRAVIEALVSSGGHFSREELAGTLRDRGRRVSLATVYRFMHVLVELAVVREIRIGDTSRFELDLGREQHDHLVCVTCGGIAEFHEDGIGELAREILARYGFAASSARIEIRSTCRVCSSGHKKEPARQVHFTS